MYVGAGVRRLAIGGRGCNTLLDAIMRAAGSALIGRRSLWIKHP